MFFRPIQASPILRMFIRNYWHLKATALADGAQRIMSNGAVSIYFFIAQPMRFADDERFFTSCITGHDLGYVELVTMRGPVDVLGVEFAPFGARVFFDFPISECTGLHVSPSDLGDVEFLDLEARMLEDIPMERRVALLDDFFLARLARHGSAGVNLGRMQSVFGTLLSSPVGLSADVDMSPAAMADIACLSAKQFSRVFADYVGLSPKTYLRIMRFHSATLLMNQMREEGDTSSDIAWRCGFYDLPHMTSEFRHICGLPPSVVLNQSEVFTEVFQSTFSAKMKKKILVCNMI